MQKDILNYATTPEAELIAGWNDEGAMSEDQLCGGVVAPDLDILVDDGFALTAPVFRTVIGAPRMAWVARSDIRKSPYGGQAVISSKAKFSGANRHKKGTMRTIALFHEYRDNPDLLNQAALLASVVAAGNAFHPFRGVLKGIRDEAKDALGILTILDVWARSTSSPLPIPCPMKLEECTSAYDLGRILRVWHTRSFEKLVPVSLTPIVGGASMVPVSDFNEVVSRVPEGRNRASGSDRWKTVSAEELEKLIWEKPVMTISSDMGVSGAAISKRCDRLGIEKPPRGYWQQLESGIDPRDLLARNGVSAPKKVQQDLSHRFNLRIA